MSRRKSCAIAIALILAIVVFGQAVQTLSYQGSGDVSAPSPDQQTLKELTTPSDTFVMVTIGEPDTLDPAIDYESAGGEILQNVYETLVFYNMDSAVNLDPMLATSVPTVANGGVSANGIWWNFTLRQDVKFHDGTDLTTEDVLYSLQRVCLLDDSASPGWMVEQVLTAYVGYIYSFGGTIADWNAYCSPPAYLKVGLPTAGPHVLTAADVRQVVANALIIKDDYNFTIRLTQPYPAFIYICAYTVMDIVSKDFVEAAGHGDAYMWDHACGTGPYELVSWSIGSSIYLIRNDNYWRTAASIKNIAILNVGDSGTRLGMLLAGDADSAYVSICDESQFTGPAFRIVKGQVNFNVEFFCFNQWINVSDLRTRYGNAIVDNVPYYTSSGFNYSTFFADPHVRKAFAAAFDYDAFIDSTYLGNAEQLKSPIPKGMFGYNDTVPKIGYDMTMAKDQLENYTTDYLATGFTIPIFYNVGNTYREAACNMLKDSLESISSNIHITVIASTWSVMIPMMNTQPCAMPGFIVGWMPDYADADDYVLPFLHSSMGIYPYAMAYQNLSLDALIDAAAAEMDVTQRLIDYYDIAMAAYYDMPMLWLSQGKNFHVERAWVNGYYFNPMYSGFYYYALSKSTVILDSTPPQTVADIAGTLGTNGWHTSDVVVNLTATDDLSGVNWTRYKIDSVAWVNYSANVTMSTDGSFVLKYFSEDLAGNDESNNTVTVKIDKTAPTIASSLSGTAGLNGWYNSSTTVTLTPSDATSGINYTKYRIDSGAWLNYTAPFAIGTDGTHTVNYFTIDLAGNNGSGTKAFKIDKTPPTLTFVAFNDNYTVMTWNGSDATSGIDHFEISIDGGSFASVGMTTSHNFSGLADGMHNVTVKVIDAAGNEAEQTIGFTVDTGGSGALKSGDLVLYGAIIATIIVIILAMTFIMMRKKKSPPMRLDEMKAEPPAPPAV